MNAVRRTAPSAARGRASSGRPGGNAPAAAGFTLIEVLLATVLLAAGLALAFATLGAATATVQRGEALARDNERMRAVEGFLRQRLTGVKAMAFAFDQSSGLPVRFVGEPQRMRFVADLPNYLGHGGPYLHELAVAGNGQDVRLLLWLQVMQAGLGFGEDPSADGQPRPPEPLAEGLQAVRFRYRALDADGGLGPWQERWRTPESLPLQIEVAVRDAQGRDWPPLVVALPLAGSTTSAIGEAQ